MRGCKKTPIAVKGTRIPKHKTLNKEAWDKNDKSCVVGNVDTFSEVFDDGENYFAIVASIFVLIRGFSVV